MKGRLFLVVALGVVGAASPLKAQDQPDSFHATPRVGATREGILIALNTTRVLMQTSATSPQPARKKSWRTRHPVAFGAIAGAIAGAAVGSITLATGCHGGGEGICSSPGAMSWIGMFGGIGAGGGAAVGALSGR